MTASSLRDFEDCKPAIVAVAFGSERYGRTLAFREAQLRLPLGLRLSAADLEGEARQLHFAAVVADGNVCGTIVAEPIGPGRARLRQLAVAAKYQRLGLGRDLVRAAEIRLAADDIRTIELAARVSATAFWHALGYRERGAPYLKLTVPHVTMEKTLPPTV